MAAEITSPAVPKGWRHAALRLFRTTAFRLSALYLMIFVLFASVVLGYLAWNTRRLLERQITETIETEINGLADQYRQAGIRRLVAIIERRGRRTGSFIYLLVDGSGDSITGNAILRVPPLAQGAGWMEAAYNWPEEAETQRRLAKIRVFLLPNGIRLFVGRDLEERAHLQEVIRRARGWSLLMVVLMGGFGALFVTRRVLSRLDAIAGASSAIMAGNHTERLPVSDTNDEFDRLAHHLNGMLDRIQGLMTGLRELSSNVAHDLRTPLTRLRNNADDALRRATTLEEARGALERAIEESDQLIRIFDALLMISRAESGNLASSLAPIPLSPIIEGLSELYEPVAEDAGTTLSVAVEADLVACANRELIGQAVSNLIDNALKYGAIPASADMPAVKKLEVSARRSGDRIEIVIADNGPGIPEADRARVLERFVRLDKSRTDGGFGLGLSLVAAIARLHGGSLKLEDNTPGLRAVLVLPASDGKNTADGTV